MRRTQLYLDDHLWNALHARARAQKTTISELIREAVRGRVLGPQDERRKAMLAFVGVRKDREPPDTVEYIGNLRRGDRLERFAKQ